MRVISAPALAALNTGAFSVRVLVKMSAAGVSPLCLWDDVGNVTSGGDTYVGAAGRFTIQASSSSKDLSIRNLEITFSGLDATVAAMIQGVAWHQNPVFVQRAIIAVGAPQTLMLTGEFSGFMDTMEWSEEGQGGRSTLVLRCESVSREFSRNGARTASDADQRTRDATDGIFSFAASAVTTNIDFGRAPEPTPRRQGGILGFLERIF